MLEELTRKDTTYSQTLTQLAEEIKQNIFPNMRIDIIKTYLSKYRLGSSFPSKKNLNLLFPFFEKKLTTLVQDNIQIRKTPDNETIVDATSLLYDTRKLGIIAFFVSKGNWFRNLTYQPDLVLTVETDGLPFAYAMATTLSIPCLYARKRKPAGITDFLSIDLEATTSRTVTLYVPRRLMGNEHVLIVDDVVRSGRTQRKLVDLTLTGGATPIGLLSLIGVGNRWKELKSLNIPLEIIYNIQ